MSILILGEKPTVQHPNIIPTFISLALLMTMSVLTTNELIGQSINTGYGKNRVQYHDDFRKWNQYESENFITYWYGKARRIGQSTVQIAELDHDDIQSLVEHRINDKIEIIVYTDLHDLKQSNLGAEDVFVGVQGRTKTIGSKMFIYFDGNHRNLRRMIRKGIAQVYINAMFSNSSLQEIVRSDAALSVPRWYEEGIVAYAASNWDYLIEDELREIWSRPKGRYKKFTRLVRDHPRVAGHSFWNYIAQTYGKSTIADVLYLTRISRKYERSLEYILATPYDDIIDAWRSYYDEYYAKEEGQFAQTHLIERKLKKKPEAPVSQFAYSPNGRYLAYAHNDDDRIKLVLEDLSSGQRRTIFKYGSKNILQETDYNYPVIAWHPDSDEMSIVYERRAEIRLRKIYLTDDMPFDEQIMPEDFHRIYSMSYVDDFDYIFSASTDGYSDLYLYKSKNRSFDQLTEDFYDDLDASYVTLNDTKGILFSSNRCDTFLSSALMDTILPLDKFDIFFFPFDDNRKTLMALSNTPNVNERQPILLGSENIVYLSEQTGVKNRYVLDLADGTAYANSDYDRNIINHAINPRTNEYIYQYYDRGQYQSASGEVDWSTAITPYQTFVSSQSRAQATADPINVIPFLPAAEPDIGEMKEGYLFSTPYGDPDEIESLDDVIPEQEKTNSFSSGTDDQDDRDVIEFNRQRIVAARVKFKMVKFSTRLDNEPLFEGLQSYTGEENSELNNQPVGLLFKADFKDLFEDYSVVAGARFPTNFRGSEYFLVVDDDKYLLDHRFAFYRRTTRDELPNTIFPTQQLKRITHLGLWRLSYPFDVYRSIRSTVSLREDREFFLHSNDASVQAPSDTQKRIGLRVDYIFDNTVDKELNILNGTRYKAYAEIINRFDINLADGFDFSASDGFTAIFGFDARHYIPVLRDGVLAIRGAGATSLGSDKMLYYLGGVQGAIGAQFDNNISVPTDRNFAYQTLAPQMRGFDNNTRNGSSYLLSNVELRLPIIQMISPRRVKSSFLRNLQLTGFYDVGTAWHGLLPKSADNPINAVTIQQTDAILINVRYFRDPLIMGFGTGLRTSLFGYFIKLDYAWAYESRTIADPRLHFSLGLDF